MAIPSGASALEISVIKISASSRLTKCSRFDTKIRSYWLFIFDHPVSVASNRIGASTLFRFFSLIQILILFKRDGSTSDGCQMSSGTAAASDTMCWPVPLAISKAHPRRGAKRFTSVKMAGRFRSADGAFNRPSPSSCATLAVFGRFCRCTIQIF